VCVYLYIMWTWFKINWSLLVLVFLGECLLLLVLMAVIRLLLSLWRLPRKDLRDKAILITGCDTGFGKLLALRLEKVGWGRVFAACLTKTGVENLSAMKMTERLIPLIIDVRERSAILNALTYVYSLCPQGLFALVNNAGVLRNGYFEMVPFEEWQLHFDVNVLGNVRITKAFLPLLRKAHGRVVTVSSICGRVGMPALSAYSASKYATEGFAECLRRELKPWGVQVVLVEPGLMKTPLYTGCSPQRAEALWEESEAEVKSSHGKEFVQSSTMQLKSYVDQAGADPALAVRALEAALTSRYPRHRYPVGWDAWVLTWVSNMPTFLQDLFFEATMPPPIPAALSPVSNLATPSPRPFFRLLTPRFSLRTATRSPTPPPPSQAPPSFMALIPSMDSPDDTHTSSRGRDRDRDGSTHTHRHDKERGERERERDERKQPQSQSQSQVNYWGDRSTQADSLASIDKKWE